MATISSLGIGSGLDLNGLLDQLESAERQKLEPISQQRSSYQTRISAYGSLKSVLTQFQSAVAKLDDSAVFNAVKSQVAGSALDAAAGDGAVAGSYQVNVSQLARASTVATTGIADKTADLGAGTITFSLGNGEQFSVDIEAGDSSLVSIRDAINASDAGVSASIVNDGSGTPWRLALASTETGSDAAITAVDFGDLGAALTLDGATWVTGLNAQLTVNSVAIESQSNQVEGAIEGLTLNLVEAGDATVSVQADTDAVKSAITGFVTAFNNLQKNVATMTSFNAETGEAGTLLGDGALRGIQSRLRNAMGVNPGGDGFTNLSQIGISLQLDGTLKVDEQKLDDAVATRSSDLAAFFAGNGQDQGFADRLGDTLGQVLASSGSLSVATKGLETSIKRLDERYARVEASIDSTIARYRSQFAELDKMVATMNSTSQYLTQQFAALEAQLDQ